MKILAPGTGLFVVGDDDQSIYGFRGSTPSIMQQFMEDYAGAMSKDNAELYKAVDDALKALIADGTVAKIVGKYIAA